MLDLLSVDDVVFVKVLQGEKDVGGIKGRILEFESLDMADVEVKLAPTAII